MLGMQTNVKDNISKLKLRTAQTALLRYAHIWIEKIMLLVSLSLCL